MRFTARGPIGLTHPSRPAAYSTSGECVTVFGRDVLKSARTEVRGSLRSD